LVLNELSPAAAVEVGAVRARPLQPAATDDEVLDVVESDEPLVLADAAFLGAGPLAEVVAVAVAAVLDDDVGDPDVAGGVVRVAEDADAVARQVVEAHLSDVDVRRAARQVDPPDVDALGPGVVAADDLAAQERDVGDVPSKEDLAVPRALLVEAE